MTTVTSRSFAAATCMLAFLLASGQAGAQLPGTSAVVNLTLPASADSVQAWSIKHGLLDRPVYASVSGKQIGTVVDVLVTSAAAPYVLVIGVGGFLEIGGHKVAVPLADVVEQEGVLIYPGATRASLKAMPRLTYSKATMQRAQFIRATRTQLADANAQLLRLQRSAAAETGAGKETLEQDNAAFQADITTAEDKLAKLEKAEAARWVLFQNDVKRALARLRTPMSHDKAVQLAPAAPAEPRP